MTTELDLTEDEKRQLRALYSVHLSSTGSVTWRHDVIRSLMGKHLAEQDGYDFPRLTARGVEIARTL